MLLEPFALWCARRARPELASRSVVSVSRGRVVHASPVARLQGVTPGMHEAGATLRAGDLEVIPHDAPVLQLAWERLLEELSGLSPEVEPLSQGRVLLKLSEAHGAQAAEAYEARVGLASSRELALLAALASFEGKPRVIEEGEEGAFMKRLPMRFIRGLGVSGDAIRRLHFLGVDHLGALLTWHPPQLEAFLGKEAALLRPYLYGPWSDRVMTYQPPTIIEASYSFEEPATEPAELTPVIALLARWASGSLGERTAGRLTVTALAQGVRFQGSRLAKEPLRTPGSIRRQAQLALEDSKAQTLGVTTLTLEAPTNS